MLLSIVCVAIIVGVTIIQCNTMRKIQAASQIWPWISAIGRLRVETLSVVGSTRETREALYSTWVTFPINGVLTAVVQDNVVIASPFEASFHAREATVASNVQEAHRAITDPIVSTSPGTFRRSVWLPPPMAREYEASYQYSPEAKLWVVTFAQGGRAGKTALQLRASDQTDITGDAANNDTHT